MKRDSQEIYLRRLNAYCEEIQRKEQLLPSRYLDDFENRIRFEGWKEYLPYLTSGLEGLCSQMPVSLREISDQLSFPALCILTNSYKIVMCQWPEHYKLNKDVRLQVKSCLRARNQFIKKLEHRRPGITL